MVNTQSSSETKFAKEAGISQSYLNEILKGKKEPSNDKLLAIAQRLNINSGWLLEGIGDPFLNKPLNKSTNNLDNNPTCLDNIKNNAYSHEEGFENMAGLNEYNTRILMHVTKMEGMFEAEINNLKDRIKELEKEVMDLKYKKE